MSMRLAFRLRRHPARCVRGFSTAHGALTAKHSIYVSESTNPYFNLSLEDWLFRHKDPQEPLLLLYRNEPCVVIGRNQNPWKEVNLQQAALRNIPFIRRRSGGGTVFHDLGNSNYSIHVSRKSFDRKATANIVVRALQSLGAEAEVNERNDICASGYKITYKIANKRAYHHGTMLISTSLSTLGDLLHASKETMITKGVASVRSPVRNLHDFGVHVDHSDFVDAVVSSFQDEYALKEKALYADDEDEDLLASLHDGMLELQEWDWKYGQTPEFEYTVSQIFDWGEAIATIRSKHGLILSCAINCPGIEPGDLKEMEDNLRGTKYGFMEHPRSAFNSVRLDEIWRWLQGETNS